MVAIYEILKDDPYISFGYVVLRNKVICPKLPLNALQYGLIRRFGLPLIYKHASIVSTFLKEKVVLHSVPPCVGSLIHLL